MNRAVLIFTAMLLLTGPAQAQSTPKALFVQLCASCHVAEGMPTLAPPIFGVINHVSSAYPGREEFVQRIVDWVAEPRIEEALMPGAIRRFGLMPRLGYKEEEVRLIAEYLYSGQIRSPRWYREHYRQEHGNDPVK